MQTDRQTDIVTLIYRIVKDNQIVKSDWLKKINFY
jgi:hypothetical protein